MRGDESREPRKDKRLHRHALETAHRLRRLALVDGFEEQTPKQPVEVGMNRVPALPFFHACEKRMHMRDITAVDFLVRTDFFLKFTAHLTLHFGPKRFHAQPKIHCTARPSNSGKPRNCSNTP